MPLRVLTWNLKHGRAVPSAGRDLYDEFLACLAQWDWDVALLQEVPPWWPARLSERLQADFAFVLTSRNFGLAVRRALAVRWPDLIKSNGGGCNAMLVRGTRLLERRTLRLTLVPERRWLIAVRLPSGPWVANLHATVRNPGAAVSEARKAAAAVLRWSSGAPVVLGGDFNVQSLTLEGLRWAGGFDVDHVFVRGFEVVSGPEVLDRRGLSDHAPVMVGLG